MSTDSGVFTTGELFWTPGTHSTNFSEHATTPEGMIIIHKLTVNYLIYLITWYLCLQQQNPYRRNSNRLYGDEYTGDSMKIMNDSPFIRQNWKSFWMSIGAKRSCLMKKKTKNLVTLFFQAPILCKKSFQTYWYKIPHLYV